jgi:hypothetical protein
LGVPIWDIGRQTVKVDVSYNILKICKRRINKIDAEELFSKTNCKKLSS